jgi:hypothetical protein
MKLHQRDYRFNLRTWLMNLPVKKRLLFFDAIIRQSGQSKHTIRRIMYMKPDDTTYVRAETKHVICQVLNKNPADLENVPQNLPGENKRYTHDPSNRI